MRKCVYCNKDLSDYTDELCEKHIAICSRHIKPRYYYSDRPRGRPKKKEVKKILEERGLSRGGQL